MPCWCHNSPAPEKHFKNKEIRSVKGATMNNNTSSSPYLRSWHLLGSLSSYKVNFRILLRYKGNQHTANTKTRQKTVLATSRLWKRNEIADFKVFITVKCETNARRIGAQSCVCFPVGANLLGVIVSLIVPQHFHGHQRVENGGPSQRHAEVEAKKPPVLYWFIELLIKHEGGSWSGLLNTKGLCFKVCVCVIHTHTHIMWQWDRRLLERVRTDRGPRHSPRIKNNRCNADAKNKHMLMWFFWSCCSTCMNREVCMGWSRQILRCLSLYSIVIISKPTTSGTASRIEIIQIRMISVAVQAETPAPLIWFLDTTARYLLRSMGQC